MLAQLSAASPHELVIFSAFSLIIFTPEAKRTFTVHVCVCRRVHVGVCEPANALGVSGVGEASVVKQITQRER